MMLLLTCNRSEHVGSQSESAVRDLGDGSGSAERMAELRNLTPEERREIRDAYDIRDEGDLKVGDEAPDFELLTADGSGVIRLSSLRGKSDVALIFGSYT